MLKLKIVPLWLKEKLEADGKSVDAVLKPKELLSTLSFPDVAFYLYLNEPLAVERLYGQEVELTFTDSISENSSVLYSGDLTEISEQKERLNRYFEDWYRKREIDEYQYSLELIDGLGLNTALAPHQYEFGMKVLKQTADALIVQPVAALPEGYKPEDHTELSGKDRAELKKELASTLIGILCTVYDFKVVAQTPLFKHYCRMSAQAEEYRR